MLIAIFVTLPNLPKSPHALSLAVCRQERLRVTEIVLPHDFCGETMQGATEQPIKKLNFFEFPRVSPGGQPLAKEREDSETLIYARSTCLFNQFLARVCGCNPKVLPTEEYISDCSAALR